MSLSSNWVSYKLVTVGINELELPYLDIVLELSFDSGAIFLGQRALSMVLVLLEHAFIYLGFIILLIEDPKHALTSSTILSICPLIVVSVRVEKLCFPIKFIIVESANKEIKPWAQDASFAWFLAIFKMSFVNIIIFGD